MAVALDLSLAFSALVHDASVAAALIVVAIWLPTLLLGLPTRQRRVQ